METEFPGAVPEIPVSDVDTAAAYYKNQLGFRIDWGSEAGGIAGISKGSCTRANVRRISLSFPAVEEAGDRFGSMATDPRHLTHAEAEALCALPSFGTGVLDVRPLGGLSCTPGPCVRMFRIP